MGPKKPLAGSPVKKKSKDHSKGAAIPTGDGHDKDRGGAGGTGAGGAGSGAADGSLSGAGQDNDEMDAYHEPVRCCLIPTAVEVLYEGLPFLIVDPINR